MNVAHGGDDALDERLRPRHRRRLATAACSRAVAELLARRASASDTPSLKTTTVSPGVELHGLLLVRRELEQADDRAARFEPPHAGLPTTSGGLWPALQ